MPALPPAIAPRRRPAWVRVPVAPSRGGVRCLAALLPRRAGWVALRSLMLALMWIAYYAALTHLALGIAAAVYYTLPIFITLFAALFIGDRIGPKGWLAVLLGFLGVLLILKPSTAAR